ncbi:MAG: tripartite tricarboxylate transporter substrate binding protein [Acetobacteraceae bacterium]|nr:tripartite tricarboxylate transporter substrate binding protein [Acetobacteraceae bacterium]
MGPRRRSLLHAAPAAAAAAALALPRGPALAAFPDRAVRIVVPYAPGGNVDVVARLLAPGMSSRLGGQPVVVENRVGAGGVVGAEAVARARPDGHTLLAGSNGPLVINPVLQANLPYDPLRDLAPVALASRVPQCLVAARRLPVRDLAELVALSKSRANGLSVGSTGSGTVTHLTLERLKVATGAALVHVPYRGGGVLAPDLVGGVVDAAMFEFNTALPLHRAGEARILAVASAARSPLLPEVPTFIESGLPGFLAASFVGLLATAGTPAEAIEALRAAAVAALAEPAVRTRLTETGGELAAAEEQTPAGFGAFLRAELDRAREAAAAAGLRPSEVRGG